MPLAVAYSGGADSTALLLAAAALWPGQVSALHVNHQLQPAANGFESHAREFCAAHGIAFHAERVDARHATGESPEEAARIARYTALSRLALQANATGVLLAQHADDQVETLLLALSRGAGLPGLASMAPSFERHGVQFHRPLLGVRAADIRDWLRKEDVAYIDDPTNTNIAFTRNRIRARLLPVLEEVFPQFRDTFVRSARHAAQAQQLLAALAQDDLRSVGDPPRIAGLRQLPRERQANLLRHWLRARHQCGASAAQMEELLDQIDACTTRGHRIHIRLGPGFAQREGDILAWYNQPV
ncbi:tRNA lysidine(34) synthetase TilS [Variovorax sp. VNK109]|uniref:tRNA lysidine(34) synthetase TilS n=1 Tax=Variovorax sp. VNK109 TaxID=3400919 RepID=UPI003C0E80C2